LLFSPFFFVSWDVVLSKASSFLQNKANITTLTDIHASAKLNTGEKNMNGSPAHIGNQFGYVVTTKGK